jgi:hypothetical protein
VGGVAQPDPTPAAAPFTLPGASWTSGGSRGTWIECRANWGQRRGIDGPSWYERTMRTNDIADQIAA